MDWNKLGKRVFLSCVLMSMAGCSTWSNKSVSPERIKKELKQTSPHIGAPGQITSGQSAGSKMTLVKPKGVAPLVQYRKSVLDRKFTVVVRRVPVRSILYSLAKDAGVQLDLHRIHNQRVTLMLKNVPLRVILDKLAEQADLYYVFSNGVLTVRNDSPVWQTYKVDYVNIAKKSQGTISLNMSVGKVASGSNSGAQGPGSNKTEVTVESEQDFWKELANGIATIMGEKIASGSKGTVAYRNIVINKEAGTVSVYAKHRQHKFIRSFIDEVEHRSKKQVLIEATVVEVELSDKYKAGIDWSNWSLRNGNITAQASDGLIQLVADEKASFSFNLGIGLNFLRKFGKAKVLSTPKIMAINNQSALLKVVDNEVYFTVDVNISQNTNTSLTTYQTEVHTVPVGFMMTLTPFVGDDGEITLYVRPTLSRILGYAKDPNPALAQAGVESRIPIVQEREVSSTLRLKDGQVAIIGGLMQDTRQGTTQQLPGLGEPELVGDLFRHYDNDIEKTELVIFIRPHIIENPSLNGDLKAFLPQLKRLSAE